MKHIRALDGLRGIAVLLVVAYHFSPQHLPGGFLGVDVFFVLSGFLITSLLVTERDSSGHIGLRAFWIRRARRLFPALLLLIIAVGIYSLLFASPLAVRSIRDDGLASLFYVANWRFVYSGQSYIEQFVGVGPSPFRHTWSLAIEEQYYLIWPLIVALVGVAWSRYRTGSVRPVVVLTCVGLALVSTAVMAALFSPGSDPSRVYYGTDSRAHLLLVGSALGALSAGVLEVGRLAWQRALIVGGLLALGALFFLSFNSDPTNNWLYRGGYLAFALLIALVIAGAGQSGFNPLAKFLGLRALVGLGLISYGIYLWHWPISLWVTEANTGLVSVSLFALRSAITLVVSVASYFLVERPIRQGALSKLGPAVPWIVGPISVGLAVLVLVVPTWTNIESTPIFTESTSSATATKEYELAPRCDSVATDSQSFVGDRVALYGNSIAGEIKECLGAIVEKRGGIFRPATQAGAGLCDFLPQARFDVKNRSSRPTLAVIFALPVKTTLCTGGKGALEPCDEKCQEDFVSTVKKMTALFVKQGIPVALVPPIPPVGETSDLLTEKFLAIATENPNLVSVVDAGVFLRNDAGMYQFFMPCSPSTEIGCGPESPEKNSPRSVRVRLHFDGVHLCADPDFVNGCNEEYSGGERRAAAAIAQALIENPVLRR